MEYELEEVESAIKLEEHPGIRYLIFSSKNLIFFI